MVLDVDLISQFAKITNDNDKKTNKETTVYGTIVAYNGGKYVKIDGSDLLTPITTTTDILANERVTVMIKNHSATVTGNISSPSARTGDVNQIKEDMGEVTEAANKISDFEIVIAKKVSTEEFDAEVARIDNLESDNVTIKQTLSSHEADIGELQADNVTINQSLVANEADIQSLRTDKLDAETAELTYAKVTDLQATNASIDDLEAIHGEFERLTAENFSAVNGYIENLQTGKLSATDIEGKYANIDFSNIEIAAIEKFFSTSGMIENLVVKEGTVTGNLVGVIISGDLIEGNTVKAEKLVVKGTDGLYYKLNTDGMKVEAEQTDENSLDGQVILAKSITATKINVSDLVAFDATIGGFKITENSLYSGVKESVDNTTNGVYLDKEGQMAIGNSSDFLKYYKDSEGNYKLEISASSVYLGSKSIETSLSDLEEENAETQTTAGDVEARISVVESIIEKLSNSISTLITDENGTSLMTQTSDGWTFSTTDIQNVIDDTSKNLDDLNNEVGDVNNAVDILKQSIADLGILSDYIKIRTYEGEPCVEFGEKDSEFKLLITNTRIMFFEGTSIPAYINNQSLNIGKAVIEEELQQGDFVWKTRSNGNLGLMWKGVS